MPAPGGFGTAMLGHRRSPARYLPASDVWEGNAIGCHAGDREQRLRVGPHLRGTLPLPPCPSLSSNRYPMRPQLPGRELKS